MVLKHCDEDGEKQKECAATHARWVEARDLAR